MDITIEIPVSLLKALLEKAAKSEMAVEEIIEQAIQNYMERK